MHWRMSEPVAAEIREQGRQHWGQAIWLDPGKAHLMLAEKLPPGREFGLCLTFGGDRLSLLATVLSVREVTDCPHTTQVLHICRLETPDTSMRSFEALLTRVNPSVVINDPPSTVSATHRRHRKRESLPAMPRPTARTRPRLPPPRLPPQNIPRTGPSDKTTLRERRTRARKQERRGLTTNELARVRLVPGMRTRLEVTFLDKEQWLRSARWSGGSLQLVLTDNFGAVLDTVFDLRIELPFGGLCYVDARVARIGRDCVLLEARSLTQATRDELSRASTPCS
jgi:hypothetical protein